MLSFSQKKVSLLKAMKNLNTPFQKSWQKFKANRLALLSLIFIIGLVLLSVFAYAFVPDHSPNANHQQAVLAMQKPGFQMQFVLFKKEEKQVQQNILDKWFFGTKLPYKTMPIVAHKTISTEKIEVAEYKGENFPSIPLVIEKTQLFYPEIEKNIQVKTYYLGTDNQGRDVLSRLILGSRVSLLVGFVAVLISSFLGIFIGSLAGFFRGTIDKIILWKMSVFWSIPTLLLALALYISLKDFFSSSFVIIFIAVGFTMWVSMARIVRGQILSLREMQYVEAAGSLGFSSVRIIFRHVLPNALGPIIVVAAANFANAILIEAGLSFLGLGVQPPTPSWGGMLNEFKDFIGTDLSYLALLPGFMVMLLVLSFNLVGNGLRDSLDIKNN